MDDIYKEHILYHYQNPRNKYVLIDADMIGKEVNALCGDEIILYANKGENDVITTMAFMGDGCAISQAAASLLTDYAKGKRIEDLRRMGQRDVEQLLGITVSIVRARCALLPIRALQNVHSIING